MRHVIVTGATGLIGSQLVKTLHAAGVRVTATARDPQADVEAEIGVPLSRLDVLEPCTAALEDAGADCLIHCATANDIVSKDPPRGFELSVTGTWNVLTLAIRAGISRVIYFSTFQVYGTELSGLVDETTAPRCETPYGLNHWFGEEVCRMISHRHGIAIAVVRPANVYGAPAARSVRRETLVPACFVRDALTNGEIRLQSSGRQRRNFVSTREVADACRHLLDDFPPDFRIYNICSAFSASVREIADLTADVHQSRFGTPLPVRVLSEIPHAATSFEVRSRLQSLWSPAEVSRECMRREINLLYDRMSAIPSLSEKGATQKEVR